MDGHKARVSLGRSLLVPHSHSMFQVNGKANRHVVQRLLLRNSSSPNLVPGDSSTIRPCRPQSLSSWHPDLSFSTFVVSRLDTLSNQSIVIRVLFHRSLPSSSTSLVLRCLPFTHIHTHILHPASCVLQSSRSRPFDPARTFASTARACSRVLHLDMLPSYWFAPMTCFALSGTSACLDAFVPTFGSCFLLHMSTWDFPIASLCPYTSLWLLRARTLSCAPQPRESIYVRLLPIQLPPKSALRRNP